LKGVLVFLCANFFGALILAKVFFLTKTKLLQIKNFYRFYRIIILLKKWAHNILEKSVTYKKIKLKINKIKAWIKKFRKLIFWRKRAFLEKMYDKIKRYKYRIKKMFK
jgi:hypothetical protein